MYTPCTQRGVFLCHDDNRMRGVSNNEEQATADVMAVVAVTATASGTLMGAKLRAALGVFSNPVSETGALGGTPAPHWDLDAPYHTWDLLDLIAYIDHWRDENAALTFEVEDLALHLEVANATIERLCAQLNEATNVPDDRCEGCSDPHCTATT